MLNKLKKTFVSLVYISICLNLVTANAENVAKDLTAHRISGKLEDLNLKTLPTWDGDLYLKRFDEIRDKKFLSYDGEDRRIPWFFTRDGCHMRSTHFTLEAERLGYEVPKKIFIFGALEIRGTIVPNGAVEPWFHAAPIVQVNGEAMVLDPAVDFSGPLKLEKWISLIVKDRSKVVYSICDSNSYLPTTSCNNPGPLDMKRLEEETQLFLRFEGNILRNLGLQHK